MLYSVTIDSLFSKPVRITEGSPLSVRDEELEITIGEQLHEQRKVALQWDDECGDYFIEYVCHQGYRKRDRLGVELP